MCHKKPADVHTESTSVNNKDATDVSMDIDNIGADITHADETETRSIRTDSEVECWVEIEVNKDCTLSEVNTEDHSTIEVDLIKFLPTPSRSKSNSLKSFIDNLSKRKETVLNESLGEFIFGCNIPLAITESIYFKNFIKALRPAYHDRLPSRKTLTTTILDATHANCIKKCSAAMNCDSVLLMDGWKNSSSNSKTVVTILHCCDGKQAFIDAWDLSGSAEDSDKLAEIVIESSKIALNTYNSRGYAVVSDNASVMVKMGKLVDHCVWHTTCNSHSANLLAKTVVNVGCNNKVCIILKEFKHADLEKLLTKMGGTKIKLPCKTRWCSYCDSYICLIKNLEHLRLVAAGKQYKKVKQDMLKLLFDDDFVDEVNEYIELFNPVCELINKCQSKLCSLADAVELWLNLKLPEKFANKFKTQFAERKEKVLNVYALSAFYLHPKYDQTQITKDQKKEVYKFLFKHLDAEGIGGLDNFNCNLGIFGQLKQKKVTNPLTFWRMAEVEHPKLANLSIKLLQIPALSAQLERVFSQWALIHTTIRNRLTFERSKKLMYVYYSLRIRNTLPTIEDDEEIDC